MCDSWTSTIGQVAHKSRSSWRVREEGHVAIPQAVTLKSPEVTWGDVSNLQEEHVLWMVRMLQPSSLGPGV